MFVCISLFGNFCRNCSKDTSVLLIFAFLHRFFRILCTHKCLNYHYVLDFPAPLHQVNWVRIFTKFQLSENWTENWRKLKDNTRSKYRTLCHPFSSLPDPRKKCSWFVVKTKNPYIVSQKVLLILLYSTLSLTTRRMDHAENIPYFRWYYGMSEQNSHGKDRSNRKKMFQSILVESL